MPTSDGVITTRMLANGAVTAAKIQSLDVGKLTAGSIEASQWIGSSNYEAGVSGWRINGDGTAELSDVTVRGAVFASSGEIENMTITGTLQTGDDGDNRIVINGGTLKALKLESGYANETDGGALYATTIPYGDDDTLVTSLASPSFSDNFGDTYINLTSEAEDDSSWPPSVLVGYQGESTQTPVFALMNGFEVSAQSIYDTTTANAADVVVTAGAGDVLAYTLKRSTSSLTVKDNIEPIVDGLDVIRRLQPIRFQSLVDDTDRLFAGFGTEPTVEAFPEADTGGTNYDLRAIVAALVSAVQTLDKETSDG